ncbi:MAG TPA: hypothetical protein VG604_04650 [Candidatus Saccharimonadales bacterium]|nr:hypothetical protein [Candidatus Saccharimonadales bacterium]
MTKTIHLIYIPGLGDDDPKGQRWAVAHWQKYGVEAELFQMNWADKTTWQTKFSRLLKRIDELDKQGKDIALVGASAGAGAAINAYAARKDKVVGCVLIAGKVMRPEAIGQGYRSKNPSFVESAYAVPTSLAKLAASDRQRILSRYALADETVYKPDSRVPGARNKMVFSIGHAITIGSQIIFGARSFIRFLKKLQETDK